jgi:hypothetical protein
MLQNETETILWNLTAPDVQRWRFSSLPSEVEEFSRNSLVEPGNETCPECGHAIHAEDSIRDLPSRLATLDQEIVEVNAEIGVEMYRLNQIEWSNVPLAVGVTTGGSRSLGENQRETVHEVGSAGYKKIAQPPQDGIPLRRRNGSGRPT